MAWRARARCRWHHLRSAQEAMADGNYELAAQQINPAPVRGDMTAAELVDSAFLAYNGRRLREACRLFAEKMLEPDVMVGMSVTGALTPAGLGMSCLIPLIENGFVDWIGVDRRQSLPRHPLRHRAQDVPGLGRGRRRRAARRRAWCASTTSFSITTCCFRPMRFSARSRARGISASDGQRRVSLSRRPLRRGARARAQAVTPLVAGGGL